jgi:hypothetical protein
MSGCPTWDAWRRPRQEVHRRNGWPWRAEHVPYTLHPAPLKIVPEAGRCQPFGRAFVGISHVAKLSKGRTLALAGGGAFPG